LAKIKLMENVAVFGCGPIGLGLIQLARASGADNIYGIDPLEYRAKAALKFGADKSAASHEAILDWTEGRGVDLVLEATNDGKAYEQAADVIRLGGRIMLTGIPDGGQYALQSFDLRRKGTTVKLVRRMGHVYPACIRLAARGLVDLDAMVTHNFALEKALDAFELQATRTNGVLKSLIWPTGIVDCLQSRGRQ
ncbi:MAG: zinc-binding dehydrogenase, partial [Rhodospirillales bacterium]|nr:zinc-binding dehydrogenase [Rhodospirillales bacterium]